MAENFHGAVEILRERGLEVLSPPWRAGRESAESKADGREIEPCIKSASAIKADFLRIEFVEIVQHSAHRVTLVVVERMLELPGDRAAAVEHQVLSNQAAGVREPVGKLFVGRQQKQARRLCTVGAHHNRLGLLQIRVALLIEVNGPGRASIAIRLDAMNVRIGANLAPASAFRDADGGDE